MRTAISPPQRPDEPLPETLPTGGTGRSTAGGTNGSAARAAATLLPAAAMFGAGLWGLDRGTMWRDEAATFQAAQRTLPQLWHLLGNIDAVHGLYYLLMHAVLAVRADEVALRLPSLLAASCTAGLVGALGCRLAGPRVGLWAGLLYAGTPFVGHYAQEGRSYALVAAGAALATLCLVRAAERPAARRWTAYAAVVAVTALLHEFALLLLAAHAVTLLVSRTPARILRGWAVAAGAATVVLLPLILVSHGQEAQVAWIDPPGRRAVRALLYHFFAGPSRLMLAVNVGLVAAAVLLRPIRPAGPLGPVAVALPLAAVPPVLLIGVSQWHPLFVGRYVLFALAGVPLLAATGADVLVRHVRPWLVRPLSGTRRQRWLTLAGAIAIAAAFVWQLPVHERDRQRTSRPDDFAAVAALLHGRTRPGDALLFFPCYQRSIALAYPGYFAGLRDVALREPVAVSGTLNGREAGARVVRARLARAQRVWVVALPGVQDRKWFRADAREQAKLALLRRDFRHVTTARAFNGTASLYVRK